MDVFEKTFQDMSFILLGKRLCNYIDYEEWLSSKIFENKSAKSKISGASICLPPCEFYQKVKNNLVTISEAYGILGKKRLSEKELESLSLANASKILDNIKTTTMDTQYGENSNLIECSLYYNSNSGFKSSALNGSKNAIYSFWPRHSEYTIGCYYVFSSKFCMKCYNSENIIRCFEVSDCTNCTDLYFSHNCENVHDSMFCFNVKNKRNAIGNVEYPKEQYLKIKKFILNQVADEIEKTKSLRLSIYNLGCFKKK